MAQAIKGNAVIGQSGGPTAVINQSLVGVIEAAAKADFIENILGAKHGVRGIINEQFIQLKGLDQDLLERVAQTPCSALGSTRDKPDEEYCRNIFKVFQKNNVRYFFYIGGNDSADAARIVSEMAQAQKYELCVFHVPKTIDNDLRLTDHCPGYGSAARFVASAIQGDDRDNASLPGVKIDIIMGRHAGWLTAASVLARRDENDGPHLVYVPEARLSRQKFIDDVAAVYGRLGRCVVAVSEGIEDENGVAWGEKIAKEAEHDSHGNVQLSGSGALGDFLAEMVKKDVAAKLGAKKLRVRADTLGYLQRSFAGYASPVDQAEARQCGRLAVQYASEGNPSGTVAMKRELGGGYKITYFRGELRDVARETKPLPKEFISAAGNNIEKAFVDYALPLVGELPVIGKLM
ncbi:MAG: 6-phosphofructokinase [Planctomycetes bacterium]|nr:6-phosphofructokinase [Planctomycetota bacterium]